MFTLIGTARRLALVIALAGFAAVTTGCSAPSEEVAEEDGTTEAELSARGARFETFVGFDGKSYFTLVAGNGRNLLRSEGYASQYNAERGIDALLNAGVDADAYEVKQAHNGEFYFNVVASNGEVVSSSQLYSTKSNAQRAARSARTTVSRLAQPVATSPAPKKARFELFKASTGKTHFRLRAGNGEVVLASEAYASKQGAQNGIASVLENGAFAERFDRIEGEDGEVRIRLLANNGETIAHGESYSSSSNASRAITRISELLATRVSTIEE